MKLLWEETAWQDEHTARLVAQEYHKFVLVHERDDVTASIFAVGKKQHMRIVDALVGDDRSRFIGAGGIRGATSIVMPKNMYYGSYSCKTLLGKDRPEDANEADRMLELFRNQLQHIGVVVE